MSRRKALVINLHLNPELPLDRRKNAHAVFRLVRGFEPVRLDGAMLKRWPQTKNLKGFTTEMVEDAINDLCNSGNVTIRMNQGIPEASIDRKFVLHLVEGGAKWN